MIYLLFKNYKSSAVLTLKKIDDCDDSGKSLRKQILEAFTITGNMNDYVICEEVNNILSESKGKIKIELESLHVIKKKQKQKEDRDKQCYFGMIKKKEIEIEELVVIENY